MSVCFSAESVMGKFSTLCVESEFQGNVMYINHFKSLDFWSQY